jgi:hypothetical protein
LGFDRRIFEGIIEVVKITTKRNLLGTEATIGRLSIDGVPYCDTLEDVDRKLEGDPDAKVYGATAIPRGTYRVEVSHSPHFGRDLPLLVDVPGYAGVRIHPGNCAADTEGCILVGRANGSADFIRNSRAAFDPLFGMIQSAIDAGEDVWMEVS